MKVSLVCAFAVLMVGLHATAGQSQTYGGVGVKLSTLGIGFDGAVAATDRSNVRIGANFFNFNHDFDNDGITLAAHLKQIERVNPKVNAIVTLADHIWCQCIWAGGGFFQGGYLGDLVSA